MRVYQKWIWYGVVNFMFLLQGILADDCTDETDLICRIKNCKLENGKFLCKNNQTCIALDNVCNGHKDCPDESDESSTCDKLKATKACDSHTCPLGGKCTILPTGVDCICPKGYTHDPKANLCNDIDECQTYGICSQGCFNTGGSYNCVCSLNFELDSDNRTCKPKNNEEPLLIYAASSSVNVYTLYKKQMYTVAESLNQVVGIAYDGKHVYWTDISIQVESIMRSELHGNAPETLFTSGLSKPEDITIDHVTGNMYFSDYDLQHIAACSNDGKYCTIIISDLHRPRGIALYVQKGQMYYTDWGDNPMIGTASMDGTQNKPFITNDIHWPNGLALDWPNERLYWVDAKLKTIDSCKLDGSDRRSILRDISKHPFGIAVFMDKIYWSDWDLKSIESCDKFTGNHRQTLINDKVIYDVHIYHSAMDGQRINPCENTICSHLCLINSNDTYTCACPKFMELMSDKHKCKPTGKRLMLLMGVGRKFVTMEHQPFGRHDEADVKNVNYQIDKMAYNSLKGNVLVADNVDKVIYDVNLKTFRSIKLIDDNIGNITALAYDDYANNLYWTDSERSTIEVYSFNTQHRAVVQHFMGDEKPIALAVIPEQGKMFVALRSHSHTHIDILSLNGRGAHYHLLEDEIGNGPVALVPDHHLKEIFWTDYENSKVSYTDFQGQYFHSFLHDVIKPVSIAAVGDDFFWTTSKSFRLNWTPKHQLFGTKTIIIPHETLTPTPDAVILQTITPITVSTHPCVTNDNNGCSHICVALGEKSSSCLCPNGMTFDNFSNTTCIDAHDCYFRCGSGECISEEKRCNYKKDCADNSDEKECGNDKKTFKQCKSNEFACSDGTDCIDRKQRCDKNFDCGDHSDERDCDKYDAKTKCNEYQFMCNDGLCIDSVELCDEVHDCLGGEDEDPQRCSASQPIDCGIDRFHCNNGRCIPNAWVCDGEDDCHDNSEETNCHETECPTDFRKCDNGKCIHKDLWCNNNNDCGDFSDESNCSPSMKISCEGEDGVKKFQCKSNATICLDMSQRCDGKNDCPNHEDEVDCGNCPHGQFECSPGECIPEHWRCDKVKDCKNGKDEEDCDHNSTSSTHTAYMHAGPCKDDEFKCHNYQCIDWSRVCDNHTDCDDGSDESANCETACKNSVCEQRCHRSPNGAVCGCSEGYTLNADKKTCSDINECKNGAVPCAQLCENLNGTYRCSCFADFALRSDKSSCKSIGAKMSLFYSAFDSIYRLRPHLRRLLSANNSKILGLDFNLAKKLIYFTVEDREVLYEFNWNTSHLGYVKNIGTPTQIAVDWITDNIYLIDHAKAIKVCHMDNTVCITLIEFTNGEHIKSLAVDPLNHRVFYSILKTYDLAMPETTIFSHNLDGTKKQMIAKNSFFVSAMTCDFYTERLYFVGFDTKTVWSIKYDGTDKRLMFHKNEFITQPIQINLFESHVFVLNRGSNVVAKCAIYGDKECTQLKLNVNQPENFLVVQQSRQKMIESKCSINRCKGICTPSDVEEKCICDFGQLVAADEACSNTDSLLGRPIFHRHPHHTDAESASAMKMVFGTILVILTLITVVMGGLYGYKRYNERRAPTISMRFENPRAAFDAARVKMCKLNEIVIKPQNSNETSDVMLNQLDETTDLNITYSSTNDDMRKLLG